jgi:hypothetical protein
VAINKQVPVPDSSLMPKESCRIIFLLFREAVKDFIESLHRIAFMG